ncbi:hypothetical protein Q3G72_009714 [Acer saccharum]|nr:hypothetical protein Q3G72_009714 [Acer saccharum]
MLMLSTCKLQRHGLNGHTADTDRQTFKKVMPVISTYEDIQPDITCIANGDTSPIFCSNPISEFLTSILTKKSGRVINKCQPAEIIRQDRRNSYEDSLQDMHKSKKGNWD